jgi:hypothetical protein
LSEPRCATRIRRPTIWTKRREESGAVAVFVAVVMMMLCAAAAIPIDLGRLVIERREAQIAADHASLAAALASCQGRDPVAAGLGAARRNGFDNDGTTNTVAIANKSGSYEATTRSYIDGSFSAALGIDRLRAGARALSRCITEDQAHGIWAGSTTCPKTIDWSGSSNKIVGEVFSNNEILISGSINNVDGPTVFVNKLTNTGSGNTFTPAPKKIPPRIHPPPGMPQIADYVPGGAKAVAAGSSYYDFGSSKIDIGALKSRGLYNDSTKRLAIGLYYTSGDIDLSADISPSTATFVTSSGTIAMQGNHIITAWDSNRLLAFSYRDTKCDDYAIKLSGQSVWDGTLYAPWGLVELSGSNNSKVGSIVADTIKFNASTMEIGSTSGEGVPPKVRLME